MQTHIFKISPTHPDPKIIKIAAEIIKKGGLVAFPTETVYGLGANALDSNAAEKIFKAKNRPADNPLIVHISEKEELKNVVKDIPDIAWKLADIFWPGPLTCVLKKTENIPLITSGGLDTVAVRMPDHKAALELIKKTGVPIAAPSANIATRPSPTKASHVYDDLAGKVDCILDAGEVAIGIESTVLDLLSETPAILRPGAITAEILSKYIPNLLNTPNSSNFLIRSPGTKYKHYAPECEVLLFTGNIEAAREKIAGVYKSMFEKSVLCHPDRGRSFDRVEGSVSPVLSHESDSSTSLRFARNDKSLKCRVIAQKKIEGIPVEDQHILANAQDYAHSIFSIFREAEKQEVEVILVQGLKEEGIGAGVMNRLKKAATKIIQISKK